MSTGTLTCTVGCNNVQINKRGDDCFGAPNTIYARVISRDGNNVYLEEADVAKIQELMGVLKDVTSYSPTGTPEDKKAWAKKRSTFSSTAA
jgi:hypothetical protein